MFRKFASRAAAVRNPAVEAAGIGLLAPELASESAHKGRAHVARRCGPRLATALARQGGCGKSGKSVRLLTRG